jgi:hypothetical protein
MLGECQFASAKPPDANGFLIAERPGEMLNEEVSVDGVAI